jgi:DNA-directed RNA polymerase specialized sigma24 family protein
VVERLRQTEEEGDVTVLNVLAGRYWTPLYQFLRAQGASEEDAKDVIQDFFVSIFETRLFQRADPTRGRFRNFLLKSLTHFMANTKRAARAQKRCPQGGLVSFEYIASSAYFEATSLREDDSPETVFHRTWIRELVANVLKALERECTLTGKRSHFQLFHQRIVAPELDGYLAPALEELAQRHGLTYKEAANQITTAKRAFRRLLAEEVRRYASSEEDFVQEETDVYRALGLEIKKEPNQ